MADYNAAQTAAMRGIAALRAKGWPDAEIFNMPSDQVARYGVMGGPAAPDRVAGGYGLLPAANERARDAQNYSISRADIAMKMQDSLDARNKYLTDLVRDPYNIVSAMGQQGTEGTNNLLSAPGGDTLSNIDNPEIDKVKASNQAYQKYVDDFLQHPSQDPSETERGVRAGLSPDQVDTITRAYNQDPATAEKFFSAPQAPAPAPAAPGIGAMTAEQAQAFAAYDKTRTDAGDTSAPAWGAPPAAAKGRTQTIGPGTYIGTNGQPEFTGGEDGSEKIKIIPNAHHQSAPGIGKRMAIVAASQRAAAQHAQMHTALGIGATHAPADAYAGFPPADYAGGGFLNYNLPSAPAAPAANPYGTEAPGMTGPIGVGHDPNHPNEVADTGPGSGYDIAQRMRVNPGIGALRGMGGGGVMTPEMLSGNYPGTFGNAPASPAAAGAAAGAPNPNPQRAPIGSWQAPGTTPVAPTGAPITSTTIGSQSIDTGIGVGGAPAPNPNPPAQPMLGIGAATPATATGEMGIGQTATAPQTVNSYTPEQQGAAKRIGAALKNITSVDPRIIAELEAGQIPSMDKFSGQTWRQLDADTKKAIIGLWQSTGRLSDPANVDPAFARGDPNAPLSRYTMGDTVAF